MDDAKVGSVFRAVRIRRGMSQSQVAEAAGISRAVVSSIERGLLEGTSMRLVRRVSTALGISLELEARWRGAEAATLLDERHARLVRAVVARLTGLGWQAFPEHTFNVWGERGSVDVLALAARHPCRPLRRGQDQAGRPSGSTCDHGQEAPPGTEHRPCGGLEAARGRERTGGAGGNLGEKRGGSLRFGLRGRASRPHRRCSRLAQDVGSGHARHLVPPQ